MTPKKFPASRCLLSAFIAATFLGTLNTAYADDGTGFHSRNGSLTLGSDGPPRFGEPEAFKGYVCGLKFLPESNVVKAAIQSQENCSAGEFLGYILLCSEQSTSYDCPDDGNSVYSGAMMSMLFGTLHQAQIAKQLVYAAGPFSQDSSTPQSYLFSLQGAGF